MSASCLQVAGAVEDASEHPVGQAIARAAAIRFGGVPAVVGFASPHGGGLTGVARVRSAPPIRWSLRSGTRAGTRSTRPSRHRAPLSLAALCRVCPVCANIEGPRGQRDVAQLG
jgi:hypothetical protein